MKCYHTRVLLIEHLRNGKKCLPVLEANFIPLSREVVDELDAVDLIGTKKLIARGFHMLHSFLPPVHVSGPLHIYK